MCGIVALRQLEYRGYDSPGIATRNAECIRPVTPCSIP